MGQMRACIVSVQDGRRENFLGEEHLGMFMLDLTGICSSCVILIPITCALCLFIYFFASRIVAREKKHRKWEDDDNLSYVP